MLYYADAYADAESDQHDRYLIRSANPVTARSTMESWLATFDRIELEEAPPEAVPLLDDVSDDEPVLLEPNNEAGFIRGG